jgi:hypothetical protein
MRRAFWFLAHAVLTLVCVGCCAFLVWRDSSPGEYWWARPEQRGAGRMSRGADLALRAFEQVNCLGGDYELPEPEEHCVVVRLRFEDGKLCERKSGMVWSVLPNGLRTIRYMVMWGPTPKGPRYLIYSEYIVTAWSGGLDKFFGDLDGTAARASGSTDLGEVHGYRVIGFAGSRELQAGQNPAQTLESNNVHDALRTRKYVLVLGVKPFATEKEAQDWLNAPEPAVK